jgi:hypothetical protein
VNDRGAAFGLRQHDRVGLGGHNGVKIGVGEASLQTIDPHQEIGPRRCCRRFLEERGRALPGLRLAVERNRIFEVHDQRVGAARHRLVELFGAVGRDEEKGAHQFTSAACA